MEVELGFPDRAKQLVGCVLSHADELKLDEQQIVALARLYWSANVIEPGPDLVSDVGRVLSAEQFRAAVSRFVRLSDPAQVSNAGASDTLDSLVANALTARFKERSVVEVEIAAAVAERLIGWSKAFGVFVAAPIAVILVILSLFGWSKFEDVRKAANDANALLGQAQSKLSETELTEKKVGTLVDRANQQAAAVERQLAGLQQSTEANAQQIAQAQSAIQHIQTQLGGFSAQRETGNRSAASVMQSAGTKLYGPWGFLPSTATAFAASPDFPWREDFKGLAGGSAEFDAAWSKVGSQEPERFKEAQRAFAQEHFFDPAAKLLKSRCGLDVTTRSQTLQEVVWALAVRTGPNVRPIVQACEALHDQGNWNPADTGLDEALIRQSYGLLIAQHGAANSELNEALNQLMNEKQQSKK